MKRIILSVLAASMLAGSALSGHAAPLNVPAAPQPSSMQVDWRKPSHEHMRKPTNRDLKKRELHRKKVVKRHWKRGDRYHDWRRHERVDWRRHHLHRPAPGHQWVRVGDDYILVSVLSGIIAGVIAAR
jgi:Ni/Co efflux regulator RcnB